jgi:hypothetical protein
MTAFTLPASTGIDLGDADDEAALQHMEWATLQYSKKAVTRAGQVLVNANAIPDPFDADAYFEALDVINNWRACHNFPLNTFQTGLRKRAQRIDPRCVVAQRIKRLTSIQAKLERFPNMTLAQMQDIAGCRAVLSRSSQVKKLVRSYQTSDIKHEQIRLDDYLAEPKQSGYRGVHMIYRYRSDRKETYNGLNIEMQLRSQMQHIWATAVETVGTFVQQALKSSQGEDDWLRFFALMGSAIAQGEKSPPVPSTPSGLQLVEELREHARRLDVQSRLRTYGRAVQVLETGAEKKDHFFLLELMPAQRVLDVTSFRISESEAASQAYLEAEKRLGDAPGAQAVLVSVDQISSLRRAYPNYFLDTANFIALVESALRGERLRTPRPAPSPPSLPLSDEVPRRKRRH